MEGLVLMMRRGSGVHVLAAAGATALLLAACAGSGDEQTGAAGDPGGQEQAGGGGQQQAQSAGAGDGATAVVTVGGVRYEASGFDCGVSVGGGWFLRQPAPGPNGDEMVRAEFGNTDPVSGEDRPSLLAVASPSEEAEWWAVLDDMGYLDGREERTVVAVADYTVDVAAGVFRGSAEAVWVDDNRFYDGSDPVPMTFEIQC
jgi:hypothetical protein